MIPESDIFSLSAILFGLAYLGFWADNNKFARKTSGALWVIVGGILLSNFNITPFNASSYGFVIEYLVPLAIPLLLFKADLRKIFKESGAIMLTFLAASFGTIIAAIIALYIIDLAEIGPQIAGVFASGYIGGTMNFVAVAQAVEMTPDLFSVAIGANSVVSVMALMTLIAIPSIPLIQRLIPSAIMDNVNPHSKVEDLTQPKHSMKLTHISGALALSFIICAASFKLAASLSIQQYSILFVTGIAIGVANLAPKTLMKLEGEFDIGMLIMYLFFAAIGLSTNVTAFLDSALNLFFYSLSLVTLHFLLVLCMAKIFKFDLAEALVGSAAALVGPAPTAAIAISRGWNTLIMPGIMCGLFGYVIANFLGVTITRLLS
jgi:uncharacterized membrane protein